MTDATNTALFAAHVSPAPRKFRMDDTDTVTVDGVRLTRIIANVDIPGVVNAGDKGGYIQSFWNLSINGTCWVHDGAFVLGETAQVGNDAQIRSGGKVVNCNVSADAEISGLVTTNQPDLNRVLAYMTRKSAETKAARLQAA